MAGVVKRDCEDSILAKIAITQKKDPGGPFFGALNFGEVLTLTSCTLG